MDDKTRLTRAAVAAALGAAGARFLARRKGRDPVHAPGHRHRGPAPEVDAPKTARAAGAHDQPWVRTSHSDSQERRFRK